MDASEGVKLVEWKGEHVHKLGDEAQDAQGEVSDTGGEELDAVNGEEGVSKSHYHSHQHI